VEISDFDRKEKSLEAFHFQREQYISSATHWSLEELRLRIHIEPWFRMSRDEWIYQLVVTVSGLEMESSWRDLVTHVERAKALMRALCRRPT